jgi:hypothetical protein
VAACKVTTVKAISIAQTYDSSGSSSYWRLKIRITLWPQTFAMFATASWLVGTSYPEPPIVALNVACFGKQTYATVGTVTIEQ